MHVLRDAQHGTDEIGGEVMLKIAIDLLAPLAMGIIACYLIWTEGRTKNESI